MDQEVLEMSKKGKKFGKSVTIQSFAKECDINRIMSKFQRTGTLSHIAAHGGTYDNLPDLSYEEAHLAKAAWDSAYYTLPSEVRREITSPQAFQEFVNARTDEEVLRDLPALAAEGDQFPAIRAAQAMERDSLPVDKPPSAADGEAVEAPQEPSPPQPDGA